MLKKKSENVRRKHATARYPAQDLGRLWVGIEINPDYIPICEARTAQTSLNLAVLA